MARRDTARPSPAPSTPPACHRADSTLDRSRGGLGLGLALAKELVELHEGSVDASSAGPGKGAEFLVRLPLGPSAPSEAPSKHAALEAPRRRVLVIEDNVDAADSTRELLKPLGDEVAVAYTGRDRLVRGRAFQPEIVLCDIGLPEMDGYAVARALRADESLKGARLVAVSDYALPEDLPRAEAAGFEKHLAKPPSLDALLTVPRNGLGVDRPSDTAH